MLVLSRFKWASEDDVCVAVVGNHDILVTAAPLGKLAGVVGVQPTDVLDPDMEFVRAVFGGQADVSVGVAL